MKSVLAYIHNRLDSVYSAEEIREFARWMMEEVCHIPPYRLLVADDVLPDIQRQEICRIVDRLAKQEPIQYILGYTEFCGLLFGLTPDVLIPRPETAELVHRVEADYKGKSASILDIGTGSGCIGISLAVLLPDAQVSALDISEEALRVARKNAGRNHVQIHFIRQDIRAASASDALSQYDCIVSNPPYIANREKKEMDRNVLDYEPHLALFVPDDDPLCFYRRIAQLGRLHLRKGGNLYFEINALYGKEILHLLKQENYKNMELIRDFYGKDRIIKAQL